MGGYRVCGSHPAARAAVAVRCVYRSWRKARTAVTVVMVAETETGPALVGQRAGISALAVCGTPPLACVTAPPRATDGTSAANTRQNLEWTNSTRPTDEPDYSLITFR